MPEERDRLNPDFKTINVVVPVRTWQHAKDNANRSLLSFRAYVTRLLDESTPLPQTKES